MKYFQMTACTPFCGEELTSYEAAECKDELYSSGKADALIEDCVAAYVDVGGEPEDYGFDSHEEMTEYYFEGSTISIEEISKEVYDKYKVSGY